jgi:hypothetical protein
LKKLLTGIFLVAWVIWLGSSPQSNHAKFERPSQESRANLDFSLPIIPGGVGFGMDTPAGSGPDRVGGAILRVTTLAEDGPGSLREALLAKGPRTIVFDVSGYIPLHTAIRITEPYVTIAGQTAPSPGISLKGAGIEIETHDLLIQHLRIRVGDNPNGPNPEYRDGIAIQDEDDEDDVFNIVIDHVSVSWGLDENIGTGYDGVHDITLVNSIVSEGLWHSIHPKGPHSKGMIVGHGTYNLSIFGNLFAHNDQRNVMVHGNTSTMLVNNLIYNWHGYGRDGNATGIGTDKDPYDTSVVGNAYIRGKNTRKGDKSIPILITRNTGMGSKVFLKDNVDLENSDEPYSVTRLSTRYNVLVNNPPVWIPSLVVKKSGDVKSWVLRNTGARPADRDGVDSRIINDVKNGTGRIIDSQEDVGGWPLLAENVRGANGYPKLNIPSNPNKIQSSGYTKLEEWLHELAKDVEKTAGEN